MAIKEAIDTTYLILLIGNALLYIPQAKLMYKKKCSIGVSILTFIGFMLAQCFAIANGIYYQDTALIAGKAVSLIASSSVLLLIIYYRTHKTKVNHDR